MKEEWIRISMDVEVNKRTVQTTIAKTFILNHGDRAHLVALEEMMNKPQQEKEWRVILDLIDELTKGEEK
jgi:hypothetical protein